MRELVLIAVSGVLTLIFDVLAESGTEKEGNV